MRDAELRRSAMAMTFPLKRVWLLSTGMAYKRAPEVLTRRPGGGGVLPYKGLLGTCGQPGYVFRDFCLKQGIEFFIFLS